MIQNGATIWARQTLESDIFFLKPDKWFKIWFYLVSKVNHTDNGKFKRGEALVRYSDIMEACGATKSQVDHSIRWFKKCQMLATRKATRGMFVTVLKYNTYQNLDSYKSDSSGDLKAKPKRNGSDTINKNGKNGKNEKKKWRDFVFLTDEEYEKLGEKWPLSDLDDKIDALNDYLGSTGKKYKSHYHTILSWDRRNSNERRTISGKSQAGQGQIDFSKQTSKHGKSFDNSPVSQ